MIDPDNFLDGFELASLAGDEPRLAGKFIAAAGDPQNPRELLFSVLRQAVKAYREAKEAWDEAHRRYRASDDHKRHMADTDLKDREVYEAVQRWEAWCDMACSAHLAAEEGLIAAILIAHERIKNRRDMEKLDPATWEPVAFELDGVLWVVGQAPDDDKFNAVLLAVDRDSYDGDAFGDD